MAGCIARRLRDRFVLNYFFNAALLAMYTLFFLCVFLVFGLVIFVFWRLMEDGVISVHWLRSWCFKIFLHLPQISKLIN